MLTKRSENVDKTLTKRSENVLKTLTKRSKTLTNHSENIDKSVFSVTAFIRMWKDGRDTGFAPCVHASWTVYYIKVIRTDWSNNHQNNDQRLFGQNESSALIWFLVIYLLCLHNEWLMLACRTRLSSHLLYALDNNTK
jgi:hypothetical protein